MMGNTGRRVAAVALTAVLVVSSACSGDDDDSTTVITDPVETTETSETTTSSTTSTTVDPDAEVKAEVEAAYLAYWDALIQIYGTQDPDHPLIDRLTTGEVRQAIIDAATQDIIDGRSVRPPDDPDNYSQHVLNVEIKDSRAMASTCVVDGAVVIDNESGAVLNDNVVTLLVTGELVLENGLWKVAANTVEDRRDGRWDCET